jgi:DNA-binding GntR family transcriptional regulator
MEISLIEQIQVTKDLKAEVKRILERHEGRERTITGKEIARLLGCRDDRQIRHIIRELITDGLPVASTTGHPAGYFLPINYREAREYADSLKDRLIEDARRRRDFRKAADAYLSLMRQGRLC